MSRSNISGTIYFPPTNKIVLDENAKKTQQFGCSERKALHNDVTWVEIEESNSPLVRSLGISGWEKPRVMRRWGRLRWCAEIDTFIKTMPNGIRSPPSIKMKLLELERQEPQTSKRYHRTCRYMRWKFVRATCIGWEKKDEQTMLVHIMMNARKRPRTKVSAT